MAGWSITLFVVLRLPWVMEHAWLPFTQLQAAVATWYGGSAWRPVAVTLECSGTELIALSAAAILAYPVRWQARLLGALAALPALFLLNTLRILTLSLASGSGRAFDILHLYVWPVALVLAAAGLVFMWMRAAGARRPIGRRVVAVGFLALGAFAFVAPLVWSSSVVADACGLVAGSTAVVMQRVGVAAAAAGPVLMTPRGQFIVTPDCLLSPIIPLWVVGLLLWPLSGWQRAVGFAATLPVIAAVAVARLLVLAAPGSWIESPVVLVHGFHQLVFFAAVVAVTALHGSAGRGHRAAALQRAFALIVASAIAGTLAGPAYNAILARATSSVAAWAPHARLTLWSASDVQGSLLLLPAYQMLLFAAMVVAFGRPVRASSLGATMSLLFLSQVALLAGVGELAAHTGIEPHPLLLRGWAAVWPVALGFLVLRHAATSHAGADRAEAYRAYWHDVGGTFPDLGGARSTRFYFENEKRLIRQQLGDLRGRKILKSDLWDEARNTRILQWARTEGADVTGIDISRPVVSMARQQFPEGGLAATAGDVRALPFAEASFDAVYSMGTIEHFDESDLAVREIYRVLKPGGRAIVGVPNRHDPFLRPLLVEVLWRLGRYDYGYEKSFSRSQLRRLLEAEGFVVHDAGAILFIPGWLRMLDLLCHTRCRSLEPLTAAAVGLFVWLDAHVPAVRRHGYLVVAVGERPAHDLNGEASA